MKETYAEAAQRLSSSYDRDADRCLNDIINEEEAIYLKRREEDIRNFDANYSNEAVGNLMQFYEGHQPNNYKYKMEDKK